jgi:hypothetical protein
MKMQRQSETNEPTTLEMVARAQRRSIVRDRLVGAFLALGLIIGVTSIESMAKSAGATEQAVAAQQAQSEQAPVMLASALVVNIVQ